MYVYILLGKVNQIIRQQLEGSFLCWIHVVIFPWLPWKSYNIRSYIIEGQVVTLVTTRGERLLRSGMHTENTKKTCKHLQRVGCTGRSEKFDFFQ